MRVIDADTHINETDATWDWMEEAELAFKPQTEAPAHPDPKRPLTRYWTIDGHRLPRASGEDGRSLTTVETRELLDPMARVRHMDELGTEVQVIYPTLFLSGVTENPGIDGAMKHSYNRWLADRCGQTNGRLRWVCLPPYTDISRAIEEIRFAKANGACGVLKKGDCEAGHWPAEEYFFPIYEECQKLDLPVCFHIGAGTPNFSSSRLFEHVRFSILSLSPINAFTSLARFEVPAKFPGVRWGFIEIGASWVPFVVYNLMRRIRMQQREGAKEGYRYQDPSDVVRLNNFYITCQVDEDLPYVLPYTGEDRLMLASDYTHADTTQEFQFPQLLQERADRGEIPQSVVPKILHDNARAFYGL